MSARSKYTRKEYSIAVAAYMAGILDGEGSLSIGNHSGNRKNGDRHYQVNIAVCSTDKPLIDWISYHFGGFQGEYTPKQMSKNGRKQVYRWQCSGDRLTHICEITLPYLIIKKRQAEILLEMRKTFNDAHNQKGKWGVQRVPDEILVLRKQLFDEIRTLHNRTYSYKNNQTLAPCNPVEDVQVNQSGF